MELSPLFPLTWLLLVMKTGQSGSTKGRSLAAWLDPPLHDDRDRGIYLLVSARLLGALLFSIVGFDVRFARPQQTARQLLLYILSVGVLSLLTGGEEPHYRHVSQGLS